MRAASRLISTLLFELRHIHVPCMVHCCRGPMVSVKQMKRVPAIFFRTKAGGEPVRDWLKGLPSEDRRPIGEDIKTVEFGWPLGMPLCRPLGDGVYEVRAGLRLNRIARVLFSISTAKSGWFFY